MAWIKKDKIKRAGYYWMLEVGKKYPVLIHLELRISETNYKVFVCTFSTDGETRWGFVMGDYEDGDECYENDLFCEIKRPALPKERIGL